jgi:PAS domain S-box-containing protein
MTNPSGRLFDSDLPSLGEVWSWRPGLVWLHGLADAGIAFAYCWIPLVMLYIAWRRPDLPFRRQVRHFSAFLVTCGLAHAMALWTIWHGDYEAAGIVKAVAAFLAVAAALVAVPLVPRGLALASHSDLRRADEALRLESAARGRADQQLVFLHDALREVGEAEDLAQAFGGVLRRICDAMSWDLGEAWVPRPDARALVLSESWTRTTELGRVSAAGKRLAIGSDDGMIGAAWATRRSVWCEDVSADATFGRVVVAREVGLHAAFAVPVLSRDDVVAVLFFGAVAMQAEDDRLIALASSVAFELASVIRRRTAEEARRESDAMLDGLFEFAPDAVIAVDAQGRIVRANAQAEQTFGYRRDELDGLPVEVLLPERLRGAHRAHRADFLAAPRQRTMGAGLRLVGLRKDGTEFPVDITLTPVEVGAGRIVMAVARDLTERREAQRRFRRLLESAPDGVLIVASTGVIVQVNAKAEELFGRSRRELVGMPLDDLVPPARREVHRAGVANYFAQPRVMHLGGIGSHFFGMAKDGREFPIELDVSPLETEVGLLAIAAIRDVTQRLRMEQERDQLLAELGSGRERLRALSMRLLEAQEQERRTIARELHDEIGQALTAVRIDLQTLQGTVDQASRPLVESALSVTRSLVRQARDLSLDLRPSLLDDLGLTAAIRWYLERHQSRFGGEATLVGDLADLRLPAPVETACFRVAQEALTNVARHAGARAVSVELRRVDGEVEMTVRDDGAGFDVAAARRRATAGHSMGILGMEERVMLAGGQLTLTSSIGVGTEIRVRLPFGGSTTLGGYAARTNR